MNKFYLTSRQLISMQKELRKLKSFFKQSSHHFSTFYDSMNKTIKSIESSDLFNEIQFITYTSIATISQFTLEMKNQSLFQKNIHKNLKLQGNSLKTIIAKLNEAKSEKISSNELIEKSCVLLCETRKVLKNSFDDYINNLMNFCNIKEKIKSIMQTSNISFNESSPILKRKLDLLKSEEDFMERENKFFSTSKRSNRGFSRKKSIENPENYYKFSSIVNTSEKKGNIFKKISPNISVSVDRNHDYTEGKLLDDNFNMDNFTINNVVDTPHSKSHLEKASEKDSLN